MTVSGAETAVGVDAHLGSSTPTRHGRCELCGVEGVLVEENVHVGSLSDRLWVCGGEGDQ